MHRRNFLAGVALLGLEGLLGCSTMNFPIMKDSDLLLKYAQRTRMPQEDPHNYARFLQSGEFTVPDEAFDSYAHIVDPQGSGGTMGGYISHNRLEPGKLNEFTQQLARRGYSKENIAQFATLFSTSKQIVFKQSLLQKRFFLKALPHERYHREMHELQSEELVVLKAAYQDLIHREYTIQQATQTAGLFDADEIDVAQRYGVESLYIVASTPEDGGFSRMSSEMKWDEFYPYLAQGAFMPRAERILQQEFPEAYAIHLRLKEKSKIK
ncbi:TPA: hypothetical protein HA242_01115 [Candidatus Woesearchaeota archaeon]|nr:hypothetical protein [Candidatus Woesearchaeota archaeon]HIG92659.1 hypothetical protein [Candidatus Woesearchaeota archaeon]HIH12298.1 hypothetical protein [Candidatus Woesearchaeota archaeon]